MLYFLYGTDTDKARAKARDIISSAQKKKPGAELFTLDSDNWSATKFDELISSQGLFERKYIVFVNRLLENKEAKEIILEKLPAIAISENFFIFCEHGADKATLTALKKASGTIQAFEKKTVSKESFNVFSLSDALKARDRKKLWVLYQKALRNNATPESLSGILFWQVKTLLTGRASNFSKTELETLARRLISLYHDSHRGLVDFEVGLERFVLSV
ncbi:MAG: hypothetical protein AAB511_01220 [Patescibacteria group bacterium]